MHAPPCGLRLLNPLRQAANWIWVSGYIYVAYTDFLPNRVWCSWGTSCTDIRVALCVENQPWGQMKATTHHFTDSSWAPMCSECKIKIRLFGHVTELFSLVSMSFCKNYNNRIRALLFRYPDAKYPEIRRYRHPAEMADAPNIRPHWQLRAHPASYLWVKSSSAGRSSVNKYSKHILEVGNYGYIVLPIRLPSSNLSASLVNASISMYFRGPKPNLVIARYTSQARRPRQVEGIIY